MRKSICNKDLYEAYLVASSTRYSGLALSELSPVKISHDSVSRWLRSKNYSPSVVWNEAKNLIDKSQSCLLIWYSSLDNLKSIRSFGWHWVAGIRKSRKVNRNETLETLDILEEGLRCHLRGYGWVTVSRFVRNERCTDYIATNVENPIRDQIENIMKMRWNIEVYHRELKQTYGIECCMSRTGRAQRNHICVAVLAWIYRFKKRLIDSWTLVLFTNTNRAFY